ncbi:NBS-LRR type resistance protein [Cucumis melo var. makuwa]|uniref:NBS-LRR type resistance protein n=1 Tax=Cucumis melo var. makuwa TaxID=1194695 RepID=A0A5A7UWN8_CUCMM|nr:NBS-LRR type resistance protein [Cucumis melo var. makuwa]TYJ95993.1 NBS-LRR type resistance protein [Cucumis melo var. makuwa]
MAFTYPSCPSSVCPSLGTLHKQSSGSVERTHQSRDPEGCTYQSSDLEGYTYQSSDPEGYTYQSSDPEGCTYQSSDPEGCTYQSSDPEGYTYQLTVTRGGGKKAQVLAKTGDARTFGAGRRLPGHTMRRRAARRRQTRSDEERTVATGMKEMKAEVGWSAVD